MLHSPYPTVNPGPPRPGRILTPQGYSRHLGQERHVVPGGGAVLLRVMVGDRLALVNDEGGQPVEVVAARVDGRIDAALLGERANSGAEGLKALLASGDASLSRLRTALAARGIDLAQAGAVRFFGPETAAGTKTELTVAEDGWLVIAAPGLPMAPEAQDTATPVTVLVQRARPRMVAQHDLPDRAGPRMTGAWEWG